MSKIATYGLADSPLQLSDRLIGTEAPRPEPSATPLATKNFSLGELLQLFSSNFPAANLQAVLDSGNTASQDISLIGTIFVSNIEPGEIIDATGSEGLPMQFLSKASSGVNWVDLPIKYPTLDEVLNEGNTSNLITKVGGLSLLNNPGIGYLSLYGNNNSLNIYNSSNKLISSIYRDVILFNDFDSKYYFKIQKPSLLSSNHTAFLQDTSGTIAYLGDIPEPIELTTVGDSGPATLIGNVLNVPNYSSSGPISTPTLNEVLSQGNTSDLSAFVGGLGVYDFSNEQYYNISVNDEMFLFLDSLNNDIFKVGYSEFSLNKNTSVVGNFSVSLLTSTRNFQFPDSSGTIALLSNLPDVTNLVPYTGATKNVNIGEYQIKVGQLELDQTPTQAFNVGCMRWNDADGTAELLLKGGNVTLQIGQEQLVRVVNKTGVDLLESNYQAVKITGAQGQRLKVGLAQGNNDANSAETVGLVTETILKNQDGFVTTSGIVRGINTTGSLQGESWTDGDVLYLSPTVAGKITNVKPIAPSHLVVIGYVVYAHVNNGQIFVKVDNGYELEELHNVTDVNYTTPTDIDSLLIFDESSSLWKRLPWLNNKLSLKSYFDTIYTTASDVATQITTALTGYATQSWVSSLFATKSMSAYSMRVNNTNTTADATETNFQQTGLGVYSGSITWTGVTAPSGTTSHTYNWIRVGNMVTLNITLYYTTAGTSLTSVVMDFMNNFPIPVNPTGLSSAGNVIYNGTGDIRQTETSTVNISTSCLMRRNSTNNGYQLIVTQSSISGKIVKITIQYFTA